MRSFLFSQTLPLWIHILVAVMKPCYNIEYETSHGEITTPTDQKKISHGSLQ